MGTTAETDTWTIEDGRYLEGGRFEFHTAPGCTVTMDVGRVLGGWAYGTNHNLPASYSADRAKHGQPVAVNLRTALSVVDVGWLDG